MNHVLRYKIAAIRQSDLLREAAHRRLVAQATRPPVRGGSVWTHTRSWRAASRAA